MPAAILHFFDKDDPNGSTIFECDTDDSFVKQIHLDIQRDSLGGGLVNFARKTGTGLISREIVVPETLVRVVIPSIDSDKYMHGFWINPRQQQVVSDKEQGGEGFTFGGPGPKHYLERQVLWAQSFTGVESAVDRDSGIWTWPETASAGRIYSRLISEDAANPLGPFLPDLTKTFNLSDDSDGVPWVDDISSNQDFTLKIGDDYLKIMWILEDASGMITHIDLGSIGSPLLQLEAWQTKGRDLTGPAWASDVVHWIEGDPGVAGTGNIATDLDVEGSSYKKASHAFVRGNNEYAVVERPGWSPGELLKIITTDYNSSNDDVLEKMGQRFLNRQQQAEKQIELRIVPGFDPDNGLYMPGEGGTDGHFWVWDTVSLTTGGSSPTVLDYQDEPQAVTGIEIELTDAVRDDDDLSAARSFEITAILNEERASSGTSRDLAGSRGTVTPPPQTIKLCRLPTEAEGIVQRLYFTNTNHAINPAAAGTWEQVDSAATDCDTLITSPNSTINAAAQRATSIGGASGGQDVCIYRGVYGPLSSDEAASFAAGGVLIQAQLRTRMRYGTGISDSSQDGISQIGVRITTGASTTIRGTALDLHTLASSAGSEKWKAQATKVNRVFPPDAAPTNLTTAVAGTAAGDYAVFELGCRNFTTVTSGFAVALTNNNAVDLPEDETTTDPFNSWIAFSVTTEEGSPGDLPLDTVAQGFENAGTSKRVTRCDHQHAHGLLSVDGLHYHEVTQTAGALQQVDPALAPDDGDVLTWDAGAEVWTAEAPSGGGGGSVGFVTIAKWAND